MTPSQTSKRKRIPLTQGYEAIVDSEDYDELMKYTWSAAVRRNNVYAQRAGKGAVPILMHRQIMGFPKQVDHRNGNGLHNWRGNLRSCTDNQNQWNSKPKGNGRKYKGAFINNKKYWMARIYKDSKPIYLGCFATQEQAARAYDAAAKKLFGEFAKLNFPHTQER